MSTDLGRGSQNKALFKTGKDRKAREDCGDTAKCREQGAHLDRAPGQNRDHRQDLNRLCGRHGATLVLGAFLMGRSSGGKECPCFWKVDTEDLGVMGHHVRREAIEQMEKNGGDLVKGPLEFFILFL